MVHKLYLTILRGDSPFGKTFILVALIILFTGCGPAASPTPVAPADTSVPPATEPSSTLTPLPVFTHTSVPSPTATQPLPADTPVSEATSTMSPTPASVPYEVIRDVPYFEGGDADQKVNIYLPEEASGKHPTLFVLGGTDMPFLRHFVRLGYAGIEVRPSEGTLQRSVQNAFCALAWVHANAEAYGLDPQHIVAVGMSLVGGHAGQLGVINDPTSYMEGCPHPLPEGNRLAGVITLAGGMDLVSREDLDSSDPPFLLVHGTGDTMIEPEQSQDFADNLEDAGVGVELVLLPDVSHNGIMSDAGTYAAVEDFLSRLTVLEETSLEAGNIIAYCYQPMTGGSLHQIYVINLDGSENRKLIEAPIGLNHHDWSPDGQKMAAVGYIDQSTWSIHVFDVDGSNLVRLTDTAGVWDSEPSWSPDGTRIAFTRIYPDQDYREEIWIMNADGSDQHWIGVEGFAAKWSPDGSRFIYTSNRSDNYEIYTSNIDGTDEQQLTSTSADESFPIWSPDGSHVAYSASTGEWNTVENTSTYEICVMDADGSNVRQLTNNNAYDSYPRWSLDGSLILFSSDRAESGHWEVYVMDADGSNVRQVTNTPSNATAINPVWRP